MSLKQIACLTASLLFSVSASIAQPGRPAIDHCAIIEGPCVDKVDPPNWWVNLPSPMLMLHGNHLSKAKFTVTGNAVSIEKTKTSSNGHYAWVWLNTASRKPQDIRIHIGEGAKATTIRYPLYARQSEGFRGFSAADTMYLILTDRFADGDPTNDNPAGPIEASNRTVPNTWHGGDFRGIEQHLDYLQQLGITTVWITPIYQSLSEPHAYHGYDATDMYAVDPHFGTLAEYQHLASALHARNMKLVLDLVPNHVGPAHPWALDPPQSDWFHGTDLDHVRAKSTFEALVHPSPATNTEANAVLEGWFSNVKPDLNQDNPLVSQLLIQNAIWWVQTAGLDGIRLDTFPYVGRAFWHDFHASLHELYPHLTTVGEIYNHNPEITSFFAGGAPRQGIDSGLDTPFDFPVFGTLRSTLIKGAPMTNLADVLKKDSLYPHPERLVPFEGNHDVGRFLSEPGATPTELKMAFALLSTLRGMPEIYSGDEIAMRGGHDPDNRHDFPGGFPGDPVDAFDPAQRTPEQADMYSTVASLFHFRAAHPAITTGTQQVIFADAKTFAFIRTTGDSCTTGDHLLIVTNNAQQPREVSIPFTKSNLTGCNTLKPALPTTPAATLSGPNAQVTIPAQTVAIYEIH